MSRAAVFETLANDSQLNSLGINRDSIFHNFSLEERPIATGPFVILRWGTQDAPYWQTVKAPERLTVWAHWPLEMTEDYMKLQAMLDNCDAALTGVQDVVGVDGNTLSFVRMTGRSSDFKDDGFNTISRNAGYDVFYRAS